MSDAGLLTMVVRTVVSLGIVLAVIGVAYAVVRRRSSFGQPRRSARRRAQTPAIEVVGRAGLARNVSAVALRFGDRVVMVGVNEQAPTTVLAEMDADRWDELHPVEETRIPTTPPYGSNGPASGQDRPRPSFFDALRDATSRSA